MSSLKLNFLPAKRGSGVEPLLLAHAPRRGGAVMQPASGSIATRACHLNEGTRYRKPSVVARELKAGKADRIVRITCSQLTPD
jgi:hypothetical protein